ncbi:hypothetical protein B7C42_08210 [Nocardia cerradoensis]|uniref:Uncharacterized protein n=1 Tax=Nocardia cerradoensis TaxID=85688 RepID=A0A231GSX2_9NOCA|nr:hypothetical protein B7C42_08210 [Nocardia cerradoensis]
MGSMRFRLGLGFPGTGLADRASPAVGRRSARAIGALYGGVGNFIRLLPPRARRSASSDGQGGADHGLVAVDLDQSDTAGIVDIEGASGDAMDLGGSADGGIEFRIPRAKGVLGHAAFTGRSSRARGLCFEVAETVCEQGWSRCQKRD